MNLCHSSGYINSTHFGHKSFKSLSLKKLRAEEVLAVGTKQNYSFKKLSDVEELKFIYINTSYQR